MVYDSFFNDDRVPNRVWDPTFPETAKKESRHPSQVVEGKGDSSTRVSRSPATFHESGRVVTCPTERSRRVLRLDVSLLYWNRFQRLIDRLDTLLLIFSS